jgi:hypothetical protein
MSYVDRLNLDSRCRIRLNSDSKRHFTELGRMQQAPVTSRRSGWRWHRSCGLCGRPPFAWGLSSHRCQSARLYDIDAPVGCRPSRGTVGAHRRKSRSQSTPNPTNAAHLGGLNIDNERVTFVQWKGTENPVAPFCVPSLSSFFSDSFPHTTRGHWDKRPCFEYIGAYEFAC